MTSRERINNLLNRRPVDRIPSGLGGCETAGFHLLAYDKLKKLVGCTSDKNRMYTFMTNAVGEPEFLKKCESDLVVLNSRMCPSPLWGTDADRMWKEVELWGKSFQIPDAWRFVHRADGAVVWEDADWLCPMGGYYFDPAHPDPEVDLDDIRPQDYNPPHQFPETYLRQLERQAKWLYDNTDFAIACGETIEDLQVQPGGFTTWWMLLASEPEKAREFLGKALEAGLAQLRQLDQAVGKYVSLLGIAHDFGDGSGVTIGPDRWREIYKPAYKALFQGWKSITSMKISLHSCGAIRDILPDLIECGVDVLNPVQISARGMEPAALKADFGDRLIFFGGSYDSILNPPALRYEEVYRNVRQTIEALSAGGGYLFAGVHNIPAETPMEHLRAILDAYRDCRSNPALLQK